MKFKKIGMLFVLSTLGMGVMGCVQNETPSSSALSSSDVSDSQSQIGSSNSDAGASSSSKSSEENLVDGYRLVTSIDELSKATKVVIGAYSGTSLFGLTANAKSSSLPWYLVGEALEEANEHKDVKEISSTAVWNLAKVGDSFEFSLNGKYLYSYLDGTHYSIGYDSNKDGADWTITMDETGKAQAVSSKGVYLEYYKESFCGSSSQYKDKCYVYFYVPSKIAISKTDKPSDSSGDSSLGETTDDSYWKGLDFKTYGNTFRASLQKLIKNYKTRTTSYSACLDIGIKAASYPKGSSNFVPFYHASPEVKEGVTGNAVYVTSKSKDTINREHTWPNSRGCGKGGGPAADPFIIRPTLQDDNSSRGNAFFGEAKPAWDPASFGYEAARGETSRIMFYTATAYFGTCGTGGSSSGKEPLELSNNPNDNKDAHTMGTLKELLKWNAQYPVTKMEKQINEYLASEGYGRNPFVDHPEYANQIWDFNSIRTSAL